MRMSWIFVVLALGLALPVMAEATKKDPPKTGRKDDAVVTSKTRFDFGEAAIDGEMKAPEGFFLQGRNPQSLTQMVKLRSHFKSELRNSKSAVRALIR